MAYKAKIINKKPNGRPLKKYVLLEKFLKKEKNADGKPDIKPIP